MEIDSSDGDCINNNHLPAHKAPANLLSVGFYFFVSVTPLSHQMWDVRNIHSFVPHRLRPLFSLYR